MPRVIFTPNLRRHLDCGVLEVDGATVAEVLDAACRAEPKLRGYLRDAAGRLREPVSVLVDGALIADREGLGDAVPADAEVYVMLQAPAGD